MKESKAEKELKLQGGEWRNDLLLTLSFERKIFRRMVGSYKRGTTLNPPVDVSQGTEFAVREQH